MEERNSNYEIKISRNGHPVPVIDGVHLHSIFNPIKEAEAFAQNHLETIKTKNNFLFLGLGFGYHIDEVIKQAGNFHQEIGILIIEPNKRLIADYLDEVGADKKEAIIHYSTLDEYFLDPNLIDFLMLKPAIIKHDPTYEISKRFFSSFLTHKPSNNISSYVEILQQNEFKDYLKPFSSVSFQQLVKNITSAKHINNKHDYLALALNEVINTRL